MSKIVIVKSDSELIKIKLVISELSSASTIFHTLRAKNAFKCNGWLLMIPVVILSYLTSICKLLRIREEV
jgi:hypothetical protein